MKTGLNPFFLAFVILLNCHWLLSQSKVYTFIQENSSVYNKSDFYIQKVIDARENKETIGSIYSVDKRKKYPADFNQTLSNAFLEFFNATFPAGKQKHKIILVVSFFNIDHSLGETAKEKGSAELNADYFLNRNDTCFYLGSSTKRIEEESDEVQLSHPNRIKRLLLLTTAEMTDSLKGFGTKSPEQRKAYTLDELKKRSLSKDVQNNRARQGDNTIPDYYMFKAGTYYGFSKSILQFGLTADIVLQFKKAPQYLLGFNANIMLFSTPSDNITIPSFASSAVFNYDLGLKLLKQVKNTFFINFNPQLNLGYVQDVASGNQKNILGLEMDAGVYLIPPVDEGVYTGLNLFYRNTNTELLGESFGLKLDLGFRF